MEIVDTPIVIGAGHAGLSVVAALNRLSIRPTLFTADPPGAAWDDRYGALRLNTEAKRSSVPHHPAPEALGRWPSGSDWAQYLRTVTDSLDVDIRHETVRNVRQGTGRWVVRSQSSTISTAHVVMATGRHRKPVLPPWATQRGEAGPTVRHASEFRQADRFGGQSVLVVGAGNSGTEIAHLLVDHASAVSISVRSKPLFVRRRIAGVGLTTAGAISKHLPDRLVGLGGRTTQKLVFGNLESRGLGPPDHDLADLGHGSGPTVDSGFIDDVKAGKIGVLSEVTGLVGRAVQFRHHTEQTFDAVICATGYRTNLIDLLDPRLLTSDGQWSRPEHSDGRAGLHFAGFAPATLTSFMPDFATEALDIASRIQADPDPSSP